MRILIVTPAPGRSRKGNGITAQRWARLLREIGHRVDIVQHYERQPCDLMIALHARRSHRSIKRIHDERPEIPLILALTGTDLYGDIRSNGSAKLSLDISDRLIVLQPLGISELPKKLQSKTRVIYQSVERPPGIYRPRPDAFEVAVVGHLRPVKDPLRTARAARLLPDSSDIRVLHLGKALTKSMDRAARSEELTNPRYRWLGELPRWKVMRVLARCRLLSLTSKMEGGANVVSEAAVCSVPVISSNISGSVGLLGKDYPGYFPVGDTKALAYLLNRAEDDSRFYSSLRAKCKELKTFFTPARERDAWKKLLAEIT